MSVIIVGAGIAGLSAALALALKNTSAWDITVLEAHDSLVEVGAGIQIMPNAAKILRSWGLEPAFDKVALQPDLFQFNDWKTGERKFQELLNYKGYLSMLYGAPSYIVHRADWQQILGKAAVDRGVQIRFSCKVVGVDCDTNTIQLQDGTSMTADLIVAADGIHSAIRRSLPLAKDVPLSPFEGYCYRALIPRERMLRTAASTAIHEHQFGGQSWTGHPSRRYILGYPVSKGRYYNFVAGAQASDDTNEGPAPLARYNLPADPTALRALFHDFDPNILAVLDQVDTCVKWTLAELPALPTWRSPAGRVVLTGDAAHAMHPAVANGGASAVEDAEVLSLCVAHFGLLDQRSRGSDSGSDGVRRSSGVVAAATAAYEHLRKPRVERIQEMAHEINDILEGKVAADGARERREGRGAEQAALKERLDRGEVVERAKADMKAPWATREGKQWLYGTDVGQEAMEYLRRC